MDTFRKDYIKRLKSKQVLQFRASVPVITEEEYSDA